MTWSKPNPDTHFDAEPVMSEQELAEWRSTLPVESEYQIGGKFMAGLFATAEMEFQAFRNSIGIPRSLEHCRLENFNRVESNYTDPWGRVCSWADSIPYLGRAGYHRHSLLLIGATGVGKSHLAAGVAIKGLEHRKRPKWVDGAELAIDLRNFESDVNLHIAADLLIVDDLGAGSVTEASKDKLRFLLYKRDADISPTVVTTNLTGEELRKLLGARVASRMAYSYLQAEIQLPDFRRTPLPATGIREGQADEMPF